MSLYNDTPLLRYVLDALKLPEGVERIALSLGDAARGPFLLVQRDGHFVTCLAEGMAPVGLHVVQRSHIEALSQRVQELRRRMDLANKQLGPTGRVVDLFRPLFTAGPCLSREEFVAAAAWAPMMLREVFTLISDVHGDLRRGYLALRSKRKRRAMDSSTLQAYWNAIWAIGHLSLLVGMEGRALCESIVEAGAGQAARVASISWPAVRQGICGPALRGVWAVGKIGKAVLPGFKASYEMGGSDLAFYSTVLSLFSIGARHKGLRGEIRKLLERVTPGAKGEVQGVMFQTLPSHLAGLLGSCLEVAEEAPQAFAQLGQEAYFQVVQRCLPEDSALRYKEPGEVPADFAAPAIAMMPTNLLASHENFSSMLAITVWLSGLEAESLYFPRSFLQDVRFPFEPKLVDLQIEKMQELYGETTPVRATPSPGRNDPCPCGSGVKYKKCCALAGATVQNSSS